jgi:hypothetical protein
VIVEGWLVRTPNAKRQTPNAKRRTPNANAATEDVHARRRNSAIKNLATKT